MTAEPLTLPALAPTAPCTLTLLGPARFHGSTGPTARKTRQVLSLLTLRINTVCTVRYLGEELWPEDPPRYANQNVQTIICTLRRELPQLRIDTRPQGYQLSGPALDVDVHRFAHYVEAARNALHTGALLQAEDLLQAAESLWCGEPLEDIYLGPLNGEYAQQLLDKRSASRGLWFEVNIRLGRFRDVIDELYAMVRTRPREDYAEMLMLALYRARRRPEALEVYSRVRKALVDLYGLEPCPRLRRLQQQVLSGDPSLEWTGGAA